MKEDENHCEGIPFDVSEAAAAATNDLLPCKSKDLYERAFQIFEDWRRKKKLLHLPKKYVFTGRVSRACRCDELSKMLLDDIEDQDNVLIVHIPDSKKKLVDL